MSKTTGIPQESPFERAIRHDKELSFLRNKKLEALKVCTGVDKGERIEEEYNKDLAIMLTRHYQENEQAVKRTGGG